MNHLAIDAATEVLSVALRVDSGGRLVSVRDVGLRHTQRLMLLVDALLDEAGLEPSGIDLVSCTRGPGSFTGLRIGMATAKGLAAAIAGARGLAELPIVSCPTLDVIASGLPPNVTVLPVIDGRKGRFYSAVYVRGRKMTSDLDEPAVEIMRILRETADEGRVVVTGPHADRFLEQITTGPGAPPDEGSRQTPALDPAFRRGWAEALLDRGEEAVARYGYDPIDQGPDYVRRSDAELGRSAT